MRITFTKFDDYADVDHNINVFNGNSCFTVVEVPDTIDIELPNGNVIAVSASGQVEFWKDKGKTLQFRSQWNDTGLSVLPYNTD